MRLRPGYVNRVLQDVAEIATESRRWQPLITITAADLIVERQWLYVSGRESLPDPPLPFTEADLEPIAELVRLWYRSGWDRLEACGYGHSCNHNGIAGYCVAGNWCDGLETADILAHPECPPMFRELAALISPGGWTRFELNGHSWVGAAGVAGAGGWCEPADGTGINWSWPADA